MKKLSKLLLCCLFVLGFSLLADTYGLKASDNTLIADLNGDGKEEIIYYEPEIRFSYDEEDGEYSFKISIDGKEAWSEGYVIEAYPDEPEEHRLHDVLYTLAYIKVEIADINPSDSYKEIVASYYSAYNEILLGMKVFRYKKGKLTLVGEDYNVSSFSYVVADQKNNKYLTLGVDYCSQTFGCLWLKVDYKLGKKGFTEKKAKSGVYTVAPEFYADNKIGKFKAACNIKVFSDSSLTEFKGEIKKGQKFYVKKVKLSDDLTAPFVAYIKSSDVKGWIYVDNQTDDFGDVKEPLVTNRRLFD